MLDQLVFGYDEGHRLLYGSVDLRPRTLTTLLGATDAAPGSDDDARLVTAMPLVSENRYALCFTWKAPEISRPGAVWAHVLLASMESIMQAPDPFSFARFAQRPTPSNLKTYGSQLGTPGPTADAHQGQVNGHLLEAVLAAAYVRSNEAVVVEQNLAEAERVLALVWQLQWPTLRKHFSFRTRDSVRDSKRADVIVARRLRGTTRRSPSSVQPPWIAELAREVQSRRVDGPFSQFLREFGVFDVPEPAAVGRLASIYVAIRGGASDEIRDAVAEAYPTRDEGAQLKRVLFGGDVPDEQRRRSMLVALLGSATDGWDSFQLHLPEQIASFINSVGAKAFAAALSPRVGAGIREAVCLALEQRHDAADIAALSAMHLELALDVVRASPDLLEYPEAWINLSPESASRLLLAVEPPTAPSIAAAISAGHAGVVAAALEPGRALAAVASTSDYVVAKRFVGTLPWSVVLQAAESDPQIALLAAASANGRSLPRDLVDALEAGRANTHELWLRAAVAAVATQAIPRRKLLPVVFGPLHEAMTSDRLPHECWTALDPVLPPSPDPAQRLRRYLVAQARADHWTESEFRRAIADSGPFASQLRHDFMDDGDDWYVSVAKSVLRAVGIIGR